MFMSRFFIPLAAVGYLLCSVAPAVAQSSLAGVGIVDMQRIQRDAAASKSIQAQLQKQVAADKQDITKEENELRKIETELGQQRALISPEAFAERRRVFEQRVSNLQRNVQNKNRELDKSRAAASQTVQNALREVIEQMVTERRLILILTKEQLIFSAPELEITDEVMKRLNAKLPSVNVPLPAKAAPPAKAPATAKPPPGK